MIEIAVLILSCGAIYGFGYSAGSASGWQSGFAAGRECERRKHEWRIDKERETP